MADNVIYAPCGTPDILPSLCRSRAAEYHHHKLDEFQSNDCTIAVLRLTVFVIDFPEQPRYFFERLLIESNADNIAGIFQSLKRSEESVVPTADINFFDKRIGKPNFLVARAPRSSNDICGFRMEEEDAFA